MNAGEENTWTLKVKKNTWKIDGIPSGKLGEFKQLMAVKDHVTPTQIVSLSCKKIKWQCYYRYALRESLQKWKM